MEDQTTGGEAEMRAQSIDRAYGAIGTALARGERSISKNG